jgi:integrase
VGTALASSLREVQDCHSLKHAYTTLQMLRGEVDIHMHSKKMENIAAKIERHYPKLIATMAAGRLE